MPTEDNAVGGGTPFTVLCPGDSRTVRKKGTVSYDRAG